MPEKFELQACCPEHGAIFHANAVGIPWTVILQLLAKYGFPLVIQALQALLGSGINAPIAVWIAWLLSALAALSAGQPLPPFPTNQPMEQCT